MTITDKQLPYANELALKMKAKGIRVEVDIRNEKIGYKIRESQILKTPYTVVLGDKEIEENKVAVRKHGENNSETIATEEFIEDIYNKIITKSI